MFRENLDERDSQRLPPPANRRYWTIGVSASVAFHVMLATALLAGTVHDGEPIPRRRDAGSSPFAEHITLLDISAASSQSASGALQAQPQTHPPAQPLPAIGPMASSSIAAVSAPITSAVRPPASVASATVSVGSTSATAPFATGASTSVDAATLGNDYRRRLLEHIATHRRSPPPGAQPGIAYVNFTLLRSGDVQSVSVAVSSGDNALDRLALDSIRSANPMPPIPAGVPDPLTVMVPIDFRRIDQRTPIRP